MAEKLKHPNLPLLGSVLGANIALFALLITTEHLVFDSGALAKEWRSLVPAGAALVLAGLLSAQLSSDMKARLVFWRWHHPLPGCRAFSEVGPRDPRVNMSKLKSKLKKLPVTAEDQNSAWYSLYRPIRNDPAVIQSHQGFLNYRDCTAIAALLMVPFIVIAAYSVRHPITVALYAALMAAQFILFSRGAATRGRDFVATVLAISSAGK